MDKPKRYYWAVMNDEGNIFEGSFSACWDYLLKNFGTYQLRYITGELGIKIARIG